MNILITGSAGFIGFHLAKNLLKKKQNNVFGIDNFNNYYSKKIKKKRNSILLKEKNFFFYKINLSKRKRIENIFKKNKFDIIFHLAGQPGVLYSFKNPKSYKINNLLATKHLCEVAAKNKVKKFIFGSSSSVYGDQKKFPISENSKKKPINYYAKTKYQCEKIVKKNFSSKEFSYQIFRFFTVYGSFGRPDMFIHKLLNSIKKNKLISLHNHGKNYRDFTYIDDVVNVLVKSVNKNFQNDILNICKSKPIKNNKLIKIISNLYGKKAKLNLIGKVKGEMLVTHGCNRLLKKNMKHKKFTSIEKGLKQTIKDFKKYNM